MTQPRPRPRCPICRKPVETRDFRPFCSKRCADVDLGRWLKGGYAIPGAGLEETEEAPSIKRDSED